MAPARAIDVCSSQRWCRPTRTATRSDEDDEERREERKRARFSNLARLRDTHELASRGGIEIVGWRNVALVRNPTAFLCHVRLLVVPRDRDWASERACVRVRARVASLLVRSAPTEFLRATSRTDDYNAR